MSTAELALTNLAAWSVQVGVLGLGAAALARLLPIDRPTVRLAFSQALLLLAIGLPLLQPWHAAKSSIVSLVGPPRALPSAAASAHEAPPPRFRELWPGAILALLASVAGLHLVRLGGGLVRLRALRRSAPGLPEAPWLSALRAEIAPRARLVASPDVSTPATFGLLKPVVVLPVTFASMERDRQEGIALHELLHARRGDWLPQLIEELLKAVFFFHPAVHWLVGRVRLAREQAVDAAVVVRLGRRESYVESLVEVAKLAARARAVPAAPFLRESHLRERVDLLLKEVAMSRVRVLAHISLTAGALVLATGWAVAAAPLQTATALGPATAATPLSGSLPMEAKAATTEPKLLHKLNPVYPPDAKADKVEGVFVIGVVVGKDGAIREARVATSAPTLERLGELQSRAGGTSTSSQEGDARLAAAALDAVRQWRYEPTIKDGQAVDVKMTLTIRFRLD